MLTTAPRPLAEERPGDAKRRAEVHRQHPIEQGVIRVLEGAQAAHPGVVHQHIAALLQAVEHLDQGAVDGGALGQIHDVRDERSRIEFLRRALKSGAVAVEAMDAGTVRNQLPRNRAADAAGRARDHRAQVRQRSTRSGGVARGRRCAHGGTGP
jgi:hypothetical protein